MIPMATGGTRGWLRQYTGPLRPIYREVLVMSLFVNLLALAVPVFTLQVYDRVIFHAGLTTLQGLAIGLFAAILFDHARTQERGAEIGAPARRDRS